MEQVTRYCDFNVAGPRAKASKAHGERVPDDEPTIFEVDGVRHEVDLCGEHKQMLVDAVAPFVAVSKTATPVHLARNGRGRLVHKRGSATFTTKDVREWLAEQGHEVAPSGRISKDFVKMYEDAHR